MPKGENPSDEKSDLGRFAGKPGGQVGSVGDSFENENQSRKRIGQLFESLVKLIIKEIGVTREPRVINIPIPDDN